MVRAARVASTLGRACSLSSRLSLRPTMGVKKSNLVKMQVGSVEAIGFQGVRGYVNGLRTISAAMDLDSIGKSVSMPCWSLDQVDMLQQLMVSSAPIKDR